MEKWINLKINLKQQSSVLSKVHYFHEEEVKKNREYLQIIVETLIFTAVQNIPQLNNAEERARVDKISDTELLHLRCRDIPWLSFKLEQSLKKHTLCLSPDIQNEIIDIAAGLVRQTLCENITNAEIFSLIVDETTDVSNDEQLSICFRYAMQEVQESFIGFYNPKNTEGKTLFIFIKSILQDLGLSIKRMQEIVPEAVYVHCYCRGLRL